MGNYSLPLHDQVKLSESHTIGVPSRGCRLLCLGERSNTLMWTGLRKSLLVITAKPQLKIIRIANVRIRQEENGISLENSLFKNLSECFTPPAPRKFQVFAKCPSFNLAPRPYPSPPGLPASSPTHPRTPWVPRAETTARRAPRPAGCTGAGRVAAGDLCTGESLPALAMRGGKGSLVLPALGTRPSYPCPGWKKSQESHEENCPALPRLCCVSGAPAACCTPSVLSVTPE